MRFDKIHIDIKLMNKWRNKKKNEDNIKKINKKQFKISEFMVMKMWIKIENNLNKFESNYEETLKEIWNYGNG